MTRSCGGLVVNFNKRFVQLVVNFCGEFQPIFVVIFVAIFVAIFIAIFIVNFNPFVAIIIAIFKNTTNYSTKTEMT